VRLQNEVSPARPRGLEALTKTQRGTLSGPVGSVLQCTLEQKDWPKNTLREAEKTASHPGAQFALRIQEAIDACQSGPGCLDATHAPPQRPSHAKCAGVYPAHLIHRERACFSGDASCRQANTPPTASPGLLSADLIDGTLLRKPGGGSLVRAAPPPSFQPSRECRDQRRRY
jgi:hypothetical protein